MVNENVQGPVQLAGKGFFRKSSNNYEPGEYHDLQNLIITDAGTLKPRPPFQSLKHPLLTKLNNFIGYSSLGEGGRTSAYSSFTSTGFSPSVYKATDTANASVSVNYAALQTTLLAGLPPAEFTANRRIQFEGLFDYNQKTYAIVWFSGYNGSNANSGYLRVIEDTSAFGVFQGGSAVSAPVYMVQRGWSITTYNPPNNPAYPQKPMVDWILHKERLWLASNDTVYFSAATNPLDFTVPAGGFFRFTNKQIKNLVAVGDTVYVIFDDSISAITYQVDPNLDSTVAVVSGVVGGDGACLYGDVVYVVKNESIYQISGHNIDKVMDLSLALREQYSERIMNTADGDGLPLTAGKNFEYKMVGWNDALYILPRHIVLNVDSLSLPSSPYDYQYSNSDVAFHSGGLFRVSLTNGSISRYLYRGSSIPADMMYLGPEDQFNQNKLMLLFYHPLSNRIGYMGSSPKFWYDIGAVGSAENATSGFDKNVRFWHLDYYSDEPGTSLLVEPINIFMRIMNFSPDNMHWLMKKFRSIVLNGDFPRFWNGTEFVDYTRLKIGVGAYSNDTDGVATNIVIDELLTSYTPPPALASVIAATEPRSYRYGCNQRSKDITILIYSDTSLLPGLRPLSDYTTEATRIERLIESNVEIVDIRTLWSYLGRGPTNDPSDVS